MKRSKHWRGTISCAPTRMGGSRLRRMESTCGCKWREGRSAPRTPKQKTSIFVRHQIQPITGLEKSASINKQQKLACNQLSSWLELRISYGAYMIRNCRRIGKINQARHQRKSHNRYHCGRLRAQCDEALIWIERVLHDSLDGGTPPQQIRRKMAIDTDSAHRASI